MGARFSVHVKRIIILRFVIIPYTRSAIRLLNASKPIN